MYFILFPALLFHSITQTPLTLSSTYLVFVAVAALMGFGVLASWLAAPVIHPNRLDHASVAQCGYRFNTYIGLSLAAGLAGASGQTAMAVIVGFAVPISNIAAVHGLARQQQGLKILPEIIKNPFIIATVLALACNLLRIPIPHVIDVTLGRLGACAIALGLMCVGATLSLRGGRGSAPLMSWIVAVRLLVMPAGAFFIGWALDLQPADRQALLLFGALPASSAAYVLAARMGGNGPLVAVTMSLTTLFSIITIPFWLTVAPMT